MNEMTKPLTAVSPQTLQRLIAVVGEKNAITDKEKQVPYLVEFRALWTGHTPVVLRPGSTAGSLRDHEDRQRDLDRDHPAGRQHRPGRRTDPAQRRGGAVDEPDGQDPRDRSGVQHHHLRGRRHAAARARGRCQRRPALSAAPAVGGKLHHRRQSLDQCRRHRGAGARHRALARARARGGAGRRPHHEQPQQAQEGQHRLRPARPVHRRGGHARRHHRGGAAPRAAAAGRSRPHGRRSRTCRPRSICSASPPSAPPAA